MNLPSIDLATLAALWIAGVLLLVPLSGAWMRWGVRPALDALARVRAAGVARSAGEVEALRAETRAQLRALAARVERLADEVEGGREPWRQPL